MLRSSNLVQPERFHFPGKYHRHPVVDGPDQVVGRRGDDGAGPDDVPLRVPPGLSQACEGEGIPDLNTIRMGHLAVPPPLIVPVGRNQAPPAGQGGAEAALLCNRLGPGSRLLLVYGPKSI